MFWSRVRVLLVSVIVLLSLPFVGVTAGQSAAEPGTAVQSVDGSVAVEGTTVDPQPTRTVSSTTVSPGGSVTVTVTTVANSSSGSISETFNKSAEKVELLSVTVDGQEINPFLSPTTPNGTSVTMQGIQEGATVNLTYRIHFAASATIGSTYEISGDVTWSKTTTTSGPDTITVRNVNNPPTASDVNVTTMEGQSVTGSFDASDPDGDSLNYSVSSGPAHGSVSVSGDTFTYTPTSGFSGSDSFTYEVSDGNGGSATATVSVSVQAPNPGTPNASRTLSSTNISEGGTVTVTLKTTAADSSVSFNEQFSPAVTSATVTSVTTDGQPADPVLNNSNSNGVVVTLNGISAGANVTVTYTVSVSGNATVGSTYVLSGTVTRESKEQLADDTLTVVAGSPLGGVPGDYDTNTDGEISINELGAAAADYAQAKIGIRALGAVAAEFASN